MKQSLINKYLSGISSREEERQLLALLEKEPHLSPDDEALRQLLAFEVKPLEQCEDWMEEDESELFDRLMQESASSVQDEDIALQPKPCEAGAPKLPATAGTSLRLVVRIMAVAAVLTGIVFMARPLWQSSSSNMTVAYVYGNKIEDPRMSMDMMEETMTELFDRPDVESELSVLLNQ